MLCASSASHALCTRAGSGRGPCPLTATAIRVPSDGARCSAGYAPAATPPTPTPEPAYELADPYEAPEPAPDPSAAPLPFRAPRRRERVREPRHVRAVPTSPEQKTASAVRLFNGSEHTRTVSGVARSLGLPAVSVLPSVTGPSLVNIVVSWELCWYRYEVDLSDEVPTVRVAGQGYELDELPAEERAANAVSDDNGVLAPALMALDASSMQAFRAVE